MFNTLVIIKIYIIIYIIFKDWLFERQSVKERQNESKCNREENLPFTSLLPKMAATDLAGPGWSQEPAIPSSFPTWVEVTQELGPFFDAFLGILAELAGKSRVAKTGTALQMFQSVASTTVAQYCPLFYCFFCLFNLFKNLVEADLCLQRLAGRKKQEVGVCGHSNGFSCLQGNRKQA